MLQAGERASGADSCGICIFEGAGRESTVQGRRLIKQTAEVEFNVLLLGAFFRMVCFGAVWRVLYEWRMVRCHEYNALVQVPIAMIEKWFGLDILRLIRNMEVDLVLTLVAVARVVKVYWAAFPYQQFFWYDYAQGMLVLRARGSAGADQRADEGKVEKGSQFVVRPVYLA